jgi:hypothetical protein
VNWDVSIAPKHALIIYPSSTHRKRCCKGRLIRSIFSQSFSSLGPTVLTLSENSTDHALCCMLNHGNNLVQLLHCLSSPVSCQLESTLSPAAQLLLPQSQQGDLAGHHLRFSNVLDRISRHNCEPLYATNTTHNKQDIFLWKSSVFSQISHKIRTKEFCSSVVHSSSMISLLTTETSL